MKVWMQAVLVLFGLAVAACVPVQVAPAQAPAEPAAQSTPAAAGAVDRMCPPTAPDMLGPFYVPGAPERDQVGEGYVLSGEVLGADGCDPLAEAMVEFWLAGPDGEYGDDMRATLYTGADGRYRFESSPPPPYSGRPPHIHIRVSAPGYETLVTQHYPEPGQVEAEFDLVMVPE